MAEAKILGNFSGNDIELCRTTNDKVGNGIVQALIEEHIPVTKNCKKIPFFKRFQYNGAQQMIVITTNPNRYGQARQVVNRMDKTYRQNLVLSN